MAFPDGWGRKCPLVIDADQVTGALTDFPVLFTLANLPSEMFDADGANPALNGGGDIRFSSDEAGTTQLACEVVSFVTDNTPANGSAQIWVKVPSISASVDTTVYVWYDKTGESQPAVTGTFGRNAVWDASFAGVYHLEEDPSATAPQMTDSSGNDRHGSAEGMTAGQSITGEIGQGLDFDQVDARVELVDVDFGTEMTVEAWFASPDTSAIRQIVSRDASIDPNRTWQFRLASNGTVELIWWALDEEISGNYQTPLAYDDDAFHWAAVKFGGGAGSATWVDGAERATATNNGGDSLKTGTGIAPWIGDRRDTVSELFLGDIDEVRLHTVRRADAWLAASYVSQATPGTFAAAGTPEDVAAGETGTLTAAGAAGMTLSAVATSHATIGADSAAGDTADGETEEVAALNVAHAANEKVQAQAAAFASRTDAVAAAAAHTAAAVTHAELTGPAAAGAELFAFAEAFANLTGADVGVTINTQAQAAGAASIDVSHGAQAAQAAQAAALATVGEAGAASDAPVGATEDVAALSVAHAAGEAAQAQAAAFADTDDASGAEESQAAQAAAFADLDGDGAAGDTAAGETDQAGATSEAVASAVEQAAQAAGFAAIGADSAAADTADGETDNEAALSVAHAAGEASQAQAAAFADTDAPAGSAVSQRAQAAAAAQTDDGAGADDSEAGDTVQTATLTEAFAAGSTFTAQIVITGAISEAAAAADAVEAIAQAVARIEPGTGSVEQFSAQVSAHASIGEDAGAGAVFDFTVTVQQGTLIAGQITIRPSLTVRNQFEADLSGKIKLN